MKECIVAENSAPAIGPYSHACAIDPALGSLLFVSGQIPAAPDGSGPIRGSIEEETRQVLDNLRAVLEAAGTTLENVLKTTVFLQNMDDFAAFNAIYAEFFPENPPARSCIQAGRLPAGVQVEVEAIAFLPKA